MTLCFFFLFGECFQNNTELETIKCFYFCDITFMSVVVISGFFFLLQHPCLDIFFFIYHQESVQDSFYFLKAVFVTVSDILNWLQQKLWFLRVISFPLNSSGSLNSSCVDNILCSIESEIFTIFSLSS